ncbi:hypothetical protein KDA_46270 [Dictyobacter alpinus]|uniref:Cytoplasmic protein n=1 Tax=Dictyobacter alpinus TaxID=2014873 RepID=A0A402BCN0_9CHLR|nr:STM4015 family protein [Dictyobacter alpinus]GCE29143.1 hypothetical protein KDA_46270 [Dictyobacter alpinus]
MTLGDHVTQAFGLPIKHYTIGTPITEPAKWAYRFAEDSYGKDDSSWEEKFSAFLHDPLAAEVTTIVMGMWDSELLDEGSEGIIETLCAANTQLPNLEALFIGDITYDESEISWINLPDVSPLFAAYPRLEHFRIRGGQGLSFGTTLRHSQLRSLIVETGGLPRDVLHDLWRSELPALEHLELWLGSENYGGNATIEDLAPLLSGDLFPRLHSLGLRDSEFEDDIATMLTLSPLMDRLLDLDLSLGTLGDEGAQALLDCPAILKLQKLDLHHHFCSAEMIARLQALPITVDVSEAELTNTDMDERERYIAVSE